MKLSEDRISHLAHVLKTCVEKHNLGDIKDPSKMLRVAKDTLSHFCKLEDEVNAIVRKKLESYAHRYVEGSRDWDILYRKHFEEEMKKRW